MTTPTPPSTTLEHDILDEILSESVSLATRGAFTEARPGQKALAHRILDTMLNATSVEHNGSRGMIGKAPTGVGKSLAYLCAAFTCAALRGERSVVSTESKSLQRQVVEKDAPTVIEATQIVLDRHDIESQIPLACSIFQGWSNYVCIDRTAQSIHALAETDLGDFTTAEREHFADILTQAGADDRLPSANEMASGKLGHRSVDVATIGQTRLDKPGQAARLLAWAAQATDTSFHRDSFSEGNPGWREWGLVSVDASSCRSKHCPFQEECIPSQNRRECAGSAVIVTNHSMIATQATKHIPAIIGSMRIGPVDHLIVDECHALPNITRQNGAVSLSERSIKRLMARFARIVPERHDIDNAGDTLALNLSHILHSEIGQDDTRILTEEDGDILGSLSHQIVVWLTSLRKALPRVPASHSSFTTIKSLAEESYRLDSVCKHVSQYETGWARWIEREHGGQGLSIKASPVDISRELANHIYLAEVPQVPEEDRDDDQPYDVARIAEHRWVTFDESETQYYGLSVSMVSATIMPNFGFEVGVPVKVEEFESPFATAYAHSVVYYANGNDHDILQQCGSLDSRNKFRLDTRRHAQWCASTIVRLIQASGGAALVLAATSSGGKLYAESLREANLGIDIYSQWDGSLAANVLAWRDNPSSVLVGTKSLMTGVDAPGQTCSLVIIDRIPRAPKNPVDEARAKILVDEGQVNRFEADRRVYAADAALLAEQGVGRLIRSVDDVGMVAHLDPRMLPRSVASYPAATSATYNSALQRFGDSTVFLNEAVWWLENHRKNNPLASAE